MAIDSGDSQADGSGSVESVAPPASKLEHVVVAAPVFDKGVRSALVASHHQGPLPSPSQLAEYERILPGIGERLLSLYEREAAHRHVTELGDQKVQQQYVDRSFRLQERGQHYAIVAALAILGLAAFAIYWGSPVAGLILGGLELATVVGAFLYTKRSSKPDGSLPPSEPPRG